MSATLETSLFGAASALSTCMSSSPAGTSTGTASREDKLLNAKKKLKSYRARQSKANNTPGSPSSPSKKKTLSTGSTASTSSSITSPSPSSTILSSKRSSYIAPRHSVVQQHGREKSIVSNTGNNSSHGKIAHGHAHRRSHSRNLSISASSAAASSITNPMLSPREQKERDARRKSLIYAKVDPAVVAAACAATAAISSTPAPAPSTSSSPLASTASTPTQASPSGSTTPTQTTSSSSVTSAAANTSSSAISDYHANRRNSRRHSRTSSISISLAPSTFDGFAAISPSGASPRKLSYGSLPPPSASANSNASLRSPKSSSNGSFPTSVSSPSLSNTLASFTLGNNANGSARMQPTHSQQKILNRQSVPAFATAAQHTLHNGRMVLSGAISPQTSPQPPQHGFGASSSSISSFHVPSSSSSGYSGGSSMLNPAAAASGMMWNRRASLGVPKSPSFFESQQLALSQSEQGIASASSAQASPTNASSTATTSSIAAGQHARKNSRHSRRISVSTRRESMEIMAGILPGMLNHGSTSPLPPSENASSKEMNRSSTAGTSSSSASSGILPYEQSVLLSSLAMEERQLSEEEERDDALARLEGRLSVRPDLIQLPDETTTSSIGNTGGGQQARLLSSTRQEKRNSWNPRDSWGTTSPFASNYNGNNNKGGNLDMLVEEEEEEEEEALVEEDEEAQETETETEREQDISATLEDEITASPKAGKRSRPGTLTFAPRKLSLSSSTASSEDRVISPPPSSATSTTHSSSVKIGSGAQQQATRAAPRPLSLMSSSSMGNLSNVSADVKLARRQSGLRSLTLTSPEHMLNGPSLATSPASATGSSGALARRRQSLLNSTVSPSSNPATSPTPSSGGGIRPFSISSTSSVLSPDVSFRSGFQFGSSTKEAQLQSLQQQQQQQVGGGLNRDGLPRPRKSFSTASSASNASSAISTPSRSAASSAPPTSGGATSGRPSLTYNNSSVSASAPLPPSSASSRFGSRRFSDLASPSSVGFGDLVMEESLLEEDEDDLEEGDGGVANGHTNILDGLSKDEQDEDESTQRLDRLSPEAGDSSRADSSLANVSVSDDPVILDLQVRALKSQVEHLRAQLSSSDSARKEEVESLRFELAEVKENMLNAEEEREMLREDIDGWRTRCADLERALQNERAKLDDERREGMLLREKVRKLGDRLAQNQNGPAVSGGDTSTGSPDGTIDASLVNAQAKLIGEMRDQIFSLAAALERERLKNAGETEQDPSRSSSPLLRALASKDEKIAAELKNESSEKANKAPQHHNTSTQSSAASGSYNFSSSFSSIHSQMGNNTEDTSVGDDNDSMYGSKSPSSPAFWASSPTPSYSQLASSGNGISIHSSSMPLRNSDLCLNYGGLQTLAEEDEEDMDDDDLNGEIAEVNAQAKKALSLSDLSEEEENDAVPELVHDEALSQRRADFEALRARTQSASTGSSMDTNDHMPLTPAKEHGSPSLPAQNAAQHQSKPSHQRSDSFIKQWSFPKGPVEPLDLTEHHHNDSFWALYNGILPPLPLTASLVEVPPFSAEITLDEEYFQMATEKPLPASRPSSTISVASRPPTSRSNSQVSRLKEASDVSHLSTLPTSASRLSLQGFSSLWGNYMRGPQTPPIPESSASSFSSLASKPVHTPTAHAPSKQTLPIAQPLGRKPLLRLQPSPLGNLNFAHSSSCCTEVHGHSHRILRL